MVIDIFIMISIIAFILLIIAYEEASIAWTSLSLLFWIFLFAQSLYIEIPYVASSDMGSGIVNITTGSQTYSEWAFSAIIFGIIIFNIALLLVDVMDYRNRMKYRL